MVDPYVHDLERGDLVIARSWGLKVPHIVRLTKPADEVKQEMGKDPIGPEYWRGRCIGCDTDGNGYYWCVANASSYKRLPAEELCKRALQRWRSKDNPPIQGFTDEAEDEQEIWVATGWHEVDPQGHPDDDTYEHNDEDLPLEEVRRWERGNRYVRLCEVQTDESPHTHGVFYGWQDDPDTDQMRRLSTHTRCLEKAETLMRKGGYR